MHNDDVESLLQTSHKTYNLVRQDSCICLLATGRTLKVFSTISNALSGKIIRGKQTSVELPRAALVLSVVEKLEQKRMSGGR